MLNVEVKINNVNAQYPLIKLTKTKELVWGKQFCLHSETTNEPSAPHPAYARYSIGLFDINILKSIVKKGE